MRNVIICVPPDVSRVIKSRIMRWASHIARMGEGEVHTGFRWGNLRERGHLEYPGIDRRILLRWNFKKWNGRGKDWFEMAQDRDMCRALVNAVMNLRVQ
jgi:hypothetical protein